MRYSGLQKAVLSLYRECLRESRKKPASTRSQFQDLARSEFEKHVKMDKRNFAAIEHLLRRGKRQLQMYAAPEVKGRHETVVKRK